MDQGVVPGHVRDLKGFRKLRQFRNRSKATSVWNAGERVADSGDSTSDPGIADTG